jgi:hypothetical protein
VKNHQTSMMPEPVRIQSASHYFSTTFVWTRGRESSYDAGPPVADLSSWHWNRSSDSQCLLPLVAGIAPSGSRALPIRGHAHDRRREMARVRPSSEKQIAANRRYPQRSTGRKTPAGKRRRSSALKHRLREKEVVINRGADKWTNASLPSCSLNSTSSSSWWVWPGPRTPRDRALLASDHPNGPSRAWRAQDMRKREPGRRELSSPTVLRFASQVESSAREIKCLIEVLAPRHRPFEGELRDAIPLWT